MENRTDILNYLISKHGYKKYLEIGIHNPDHNYIHIIAEDKTGVDPDAHAKATFICTSDEFFKNNKKQFDLIFVDGLHEAKQVYRDVENALKCISSNGMVVMHDCNPENEKMQKVPRVQGEWTGDVWKAYICIRENYTDIKAQVVDLDHGIGILQKTKNHNQFKAGQKLTYSNLEKYRKEWLNLINVDELIKDQIDLKFAFGCMVNDMKRLDMILRNSSIGNVPCYTIYEPESAAKGLNTLLDTIEKSGAEISILSHQDMFYREHWLPTVKKQLALLPKDWVIAGIVGKDEKGVLCGRFHDMSSPLWIVSDHDFPVQCSCIDECTIIVNMKTGFRFDEALEGFDLYGTYACLRANEMGSAWILDSWAEHYCTRFHSEWEPSETFKKMWRWLYDRFPGKYLDSTVLVGKEQEKEFSRKDKIKVTYNEFGKMKAA